MNDEERAKILEELNERIQEAKNLDDYEAVFALENFHQWFIEYYAEKLL